MSDSLNALPPGTVVCGYVIESELGSGGFSIVYLARHQFKSDWLYAIKEKLFRSATSFISISLVRSRLAPVWAFE